MKAMQIDEPKPIEKNSLVLKEIEKPKAQKNELLIRVLVCGVCRTDLHIAEGDIKRGKYPITPGHQVVGVVEELGEACHRFKKGQRVGVAWLGHTCQSCSFCSLGQENLCEKSLYTGYQKMGGYAEYLTAEEEYVYSIPDLFSNEEAAPLLCAGIIGYRAYKRCEVKKGGKLGIIGFGSSAHLTFQIAQFHGCEIHVATRDSKHQNLAREMGAKTVSSGEKPFSELLDSIIVFAPAGELVPLALESLKPGGTCSLAGIYMSDIPKMAYEKHLFHEKNLRSVEANTRQDGKEFLEIASQASITAKIETFSLEKASEALMKLKKDAIEGSAVLKISE